MTSASAAVPRWLDLLDGEKENASTAANATDSPSKNTRSAKKFAADVEPMLAVQHQQLVSEASKLTDSIKRLEEQEQSLKTQVDRVQAEVDKANLTLEELVDQLRTQGFPVPNGASALSNPSAVKALVSAVKVQERKLSERVRAVERTIDERSSKEVRQREAMEKQAQQIERRLAEYEAALAAEQARLEEDKRQAASAYAKDQQVRARAAALKEEEELRARLAALEADRKQLLAAREAHTAKLTGEFATRLAAIVDRIRALIDRQETLDANRQLILSMGRRRTHR